MSLPPAHILSVGRRTLAWVSAGNEEGSRQTMKGDGSTAHEVSRWDTGLPCFREHCCPLAFTRQSQDSTSHLP